jgi:hypothetical protein
MRFVGWNDGIETCALINKQRASYGKIAAMLGV